MYMYTWVHYWSSYAYNHGIVFTRFHIWEPELILFMFLHSYQFLAFYIPQEAPCATPLLAACGKNHPQVASYLISKGARVNYKNKVIHYLYCFVDWFIEQIFPPRKAPHLSMQLLTKAIELLFNY